MKKEFVLLGLGKMGMAVAENLTEKGIDLLATDKSDDLVIEAKKREINAFGSLKELFGAASHPYIVGLLVPSPVVDDAIAEIKPFLKEGDIIIDMGNSFFKDSIRRAKELKEKNIEFLDVGTSGGLSGARGGGCLMIGGKKETFLKTEWLFKAISKNNSYVYLGESGAGHLVKGYHNLVEYGYLQALAEGLVCIDEISKKEDIHINIIDVCSIWNRGSIAESRITRDAETALKTNPTLQGISGAVFGQTHKEMETLVNIAKDTGIDLFSCENAVKARILSQKKPTKTGKIINAIRNVFGGHQEWKKQ